MTGIEPVRLDTWWYTYPQVDAQLVSGQVLSGVLTLGFSLKTKVLRIPRWCLSLDHACGAVCSVSGNRPMPADSSCTLHFKYFWVREQHQESTASVTAAWWSHQRNFLCFPYRERLDVSVLKIFYFFLNYFDIKYSLSKYNVSFNFELVFYCLKSPLTIWSIEGGTELHLLL